MVRNPNLKDPDLYLKNQNFRDHNFMNNDLFASFLKEEWKESFVETNYTNSLLRNRMLNEMFAETVPVILHEDDLNAIKTAAETLFQFKDIPLFKQFDTAIEKILDRMKISAFDDHKTDHDVLQFERGSDYKGSEFLGMLFSASKEDQVVSFQYKKFNSNQSQLTS